MPSPDGSPDAHERELVAFMGDPATHAVAHVDVIETHAARVFLAGPDAYKVKKRVRLPFLDFSTLAERHRAAAREMEINAPHAPGLYLGLVAIVRAADGHLRLGGEGTIVDWAVHMRRFDQAALLARQAEQGPLPDALCKALAAMTARYHRDSLVEEGADGARALEPVVRQLVEALGAGQQDLGQHAAFAERLQAVSARTASLLQARGQVGCVRRCHGDLHLNNVVLIDGAPVPFDALEFSEQLATIDVLYDLAFLLMDLDFRGDRHAANVVLNAYVAAAPVGGEIEGLAALPLFLACRAGVRAAVGIERVAQTTGIMQDEARSAVARYAALALSYLEPPPPVLIAVGGLSGTGKSTLAAGLAGTVGPAPGALHVRSDVERKAMFGVSETERLTPEHYRAEVSDKVYARVLQKARGALSTGHAVIVDAVFAKPAERAAIEAVARECGCTFAGLWLTAAHETLFARVEQRRGDASDADRAVVAKQLSYDTGPVTWSKVDAGGAPEQSLNLAKARLRQANFRLVE